MVEPAIPGEGCLRIVHILRSPLGGLFRHVLDLAGAQIERGHSVGLVADSTTGGSHADAVLSALAPRLALGLLRLPMRRDPHPLDAAVVWRVGRHLRALGPDVVHGHGAKGALYARWPGLFAFSGHRPARVYTPHGGSLHYDPRTPTGALVLGTERVLAARTDLLLFESSYAAERYRAVIGEPPCPVRIVHNGLREGEFEAAAAGPEAADLLFVGELRMLKGVDVLLQAMAAVPALLGRPVSAVLVGSGPDRDQFEGMARDLGLAAQVRFTGPLPVREAFRLGKLLVVPSRAESLPYVVLEAAAARVPLVASRVGGIPEIVGGATELLVPPDDPAALARTLASQLALPPARRAEAALALSRFVETRFSVARMAEGVLGGYRDALAGAPALLPAATGAARSRGYSRLRHHTG